MSNGLISGAPFLLESMVIIYNKKHFNELGIIPPTIEEPWDWEKLRKAALALTVDRIMMGFLNAMEHLLV